MIPELGRSAKEGIDYPSSILGLPLWLSWSRIHLQCRRPWFDPWVGKIPWRRERLPAPVFWPGEFHGLYGPWDCKESDMTERLNCTELYSPWNSPGQNTGKGSILPPGVGSLPQGIFSTQGSNPGLLHGRWILYQLSQQEAQEYWSG